MPLPLDIGEEASFWFPAFRSHAGFTALALPNEGPYKPFHEQAAILAEVKDIPTPASTAALASSLVRVQKAILAAFPPPKWPGGNFPSVLRHMIREEEWFLGLTQNRWDEKDLLTLIATDKMEAAGALSKLLDPTASAASNVAAASSARFKSILDRLSNERLNIRFRALANDLVKELDSFDELGSSELVMKAEKIIPQAQIDHEASEARHHASTLRRLIRLPIRQSSMPKRVP